MATIRDADFGAGDGMEATNRPHGPAFPYGFLVWPNQKARAFQLYAWEEVAQNFLKICPAGDLPSSVEREAFGAAVSDELLALQQNYPNPFNPATIAMNADKNITATFTVIGGSGNG